MHTEYPSNKYQYSSSTRLWSLHFKTSLFPVVCCSGQSSAADAKGNQARLWCPYVEGIVTKFIWSSSRTSWLFRNINFLSIEESLPIYVYYVLVLHLMLSIALCLWIVYSWLLSRFSLTFLWYIVAIQMIRKKITIRRNKTKSRK